MEWLTEIFTGETFLQAILVISLISAVGIALGSVKIAGVSLGVTFVFFTGILAGHFGVKIDQDMLILMQNFGLVLFIYSLGVHVVLEVLIKEYYEKTGNRVGFKVSGGVSSTADAVKYYTIVKEVLGEEWLNNRYFRIGTSRAANYILSSIVGKEVKYF